MLKVHGYPGPIVVIPGGAPKEVLFLAGAICAGYSKAPESDPVKVQVTQNDRVEQISVLPILPSEAKRFLIQ
jgi:predicted ribosome quality control (RQC) complex YloA/Tae2 family protein